MLVRAFDFDLPEALIAQAPPEVRGQSRLLRMALASGGLTHGAMADLPSWLRPDDLVVVNDTRVFPARLLGRRDPSGGGVECLLVTRRDEAGDDGPEERWEALVSPGQKLQPGARMRFELPNGTDGPVLQAEVLARGDFGRRELRLWTTDGAPVRAAVDVLGHIPLPPYIKRPDAGADRERYQTVYATHRGSIAAPTAGLHFTPDTFAAMAALGIRTVSVTLHVGYGTFQPIRVDEVEAHRMEREHYEISTEAAAAINTALDDGRRVVAVGTTTTRALESAAVDGAGRVRAGRASTALFVYPGFRFQVVGGLVTNFHLPQSSLLMLVSALGGRERVLAAYREAVAQRYRFYSYGDAMCLL